MLLSSNNVIKTVSEKLQERKKGPRGHRKHDPLIEEDFVPRGWFSSGSVGLSCFSLSGGIWSSQSEAETKQISCQIMF